MQRSRFVGFPMALAIAILAVTGGCETQESKIKEAAEASKNVAPPPPGKPPLKASGPSKVAGPHMPRL